MRSDFPVTRGDNDIMKTLKVILGVTLGITLLGALLIGGYLAVKFGIGFFTSMGFQVAGFTSVIVIVALLVAMIISRSIRQASPHNTANQLHAEKAATYQFFIELWGALLQPRHGSEDRNPNVWLAELSALDHLLALYGSPRVVKAHAALRNLTREHDAQSPQARAQFAQALLAIRKDLGSGVGGLSPQDLEQLLFADADQASTPIKANAQQNGRPRVSFVSNSA